MVNETKRHAVKVPIEIVKHRNLEIARFLRLGCKNRKKLNEKQWS